jgi:hypothetical protein
LVYGSGMSHTDPRKPRNEIKTRRTTVSFSEVEWELIEQLKKAMFQTTASGLMVALLNQEAQRRGLVAGGNGQ